MKYNIKRGRDTPLFPFVLNLCIIFSVKSSTYIIFLLKTLLYFFNSAYREMKNRQNSRVKNHSCKWFSLTNFAIYQMYGSISSRIEYKFIRIGWSF